MRARRTLLIGLGAAAVLAAGLGAGVLIKPQPSEQPSAPPAPQTAAPLAAQDAPKPAAASASLLLYCQFYVFTEQRPRLGLLFDVAERGGAPVFAQIYLAENNGERTDYDGKETPRPEWAYDPATEPKTIASTIKVADTSQAGQHDEDIAIELYGYDLKRNSSVFFEASLKNVHFQNLPGKCRQAAG